MKEDKENKKYNKDRIPPVLIYNGLRYKYSQTKAGLLLYVYYDNSRAFYDMANEMAIVVKDRKDKRESARFIVLFCLNSYGTYNGHGCISPMRMKGMPRNCVPVWDEPDAIYRCTLI